MIETLGDRLRRLRQQNHLSIAEAARRAGLHRTAWVLYEQGRLPDLRHLTRIAAVLDLPASELLVGLDHWLRSLPLRIRRVSSP